MCILDRLHKNDGHLLGEAPTVEQVRDNWEKVRKSNIFCSNL